MSRNFLQLWHHTTAKQHLCQDWILGHSASDRLGSVAPDDTVWVVTVYPEGELVLLGMVLVGECTDLEGARRKLDYDVYPANYHVIARPGTEDSLREVDLMDVAGDLRFVSKKNDRLDLVDGQVNAQQLQSIRELTEQSAKILGEKWLGNQSATRKRRSFRRGFRKRQR